MNYSHGQIALDIGAYCALLLHIYYIFVGGQMVRANPSHSLSLLILADLSHELYLGQGLVSMPHQKEELSLHSQEATTVRSMLLRCAHSCNIYILVAVHAHVTTNCNNV